MSEKSYTLIESQIVSLYGRIKNKSLSLDVIMNTPRSFVVLVELFWMENIVLLIWDYYLS